MHRVFLGLGSNLGDREKAISVALEEIGKVLGSIQKTSSIIETAAWGKTDLPDYLNLVVEIKTSLWPLALIDSILKLEEKLGRIRTQKWDSRLIDIDILYFNDWHFKMPKLEIPHPFIAERKFVLKPLTEISPNFVHPICKKSNSGLLEKLETGHDKRSTY
ncbi:MAG: 2-amino-4-hydroxy-6-hydroxymethyldihydropteridine diphosphokinase [Arcticibacterium sp.]|jgi:2-amino-4-hydroxy-6-hydroxymethyldihydropteridine diphosphokinase